MSVKGSILSAKLAATTAVATTSSGVGTTLEWIPSNFGNIATLVGIVLSTVLIRLHLANLKKTNLEIQIMRKKEAERLAVIESRKQAGLEIRRADDRAE